VPREPLEITLEIQEEGADSVWLDELTRDLIAEIASLDAQAAKAATKPPQGAKSTTGLTVSTLLVICASSPVMAEVIGLLRDWLNRSRGRRIRITACGTTIELTGSNEKAILPVLQWLEACQKGSGRE
jgi:hypothetical protein